MYTKEIDDPRVHGSSSAKQRGLNLLRSARRVQLKRLMRARDDPAFIDFQLAMRQTEIVRPISDLFLRQLHVVTVYDLRDDAAWRFAPIGVLSHVERDFINLHQMKSFAKTFNLPIIRWRCTLVDGSAYGAERAKCIIRSRTKLMVVFC